MYRLESIEFVILHGFLYVLPEDEFISDSEDEKLFEKIAMN